MILGQSELDLYNGSPVDILSSGRRPLGIRLFLELRFLVISLDLRDVAYLREPLCCRCVWQKGAFFRLLNFCHIHRGLFLGLSMHH